MNKIHYIRIAAIGSVTLMGILLVLEIWGLINLGEEYAFRIIGTLGIIFIVTTFIHEILRKDSGGSQK